MHSPIKREAGGVPPLNRCSRPFGPASVLVVALVASACSSDTPHGLAESSAPATARRPTAESILTEAATALRAVETVRYEFVFGGPDDPSGWVTGTTWMRQRTDLADSSIRVEGTVHAQPARGVEEESFAYGVDGERAWASEGDGGLQAAPAGAGGNRLSARAVYGYLPEFVEAEPLWRERSMATETELLEPVTIDGHLSDVVRVVIDLDRGETSEIVWSIARSDRLPRRGRWIAPFTGPDGMVFTLANLEVDLDLPHGLFAPPEEAPEPRPTTVAVGEVVPSWSLERSDGATVRSQDLAGRVVVLDFWNTWCPICRTIAPSMHGLAREMASDEVRFFGVNILETGDPVAYWEESAPPYPTLLEGEALASDLDLPWQPGVAVVGPDGTLLYKQLGASADRIARVRAAIERGLGG